jgi:hypothetical protein
MGSIEILDPMTGKLGLAPTKRDNGALKVYLQLEAGESIILRTFDFKVEAGPAWPYHYIDGTPTTLTGTWNVKFIEGGPTLPASFQTDKLGSWTDSGEAEAQRFAGTAVYSITFDAPGGRNGPWSLSLGEVCQSARVRLNGKDLGTLFVAPFLLPVENLQPKGNLLEVEVTNSSANRVRDLDLSHVPWKIFHAPNVLSIAGGSFDASKWPLTNSGLLGPVTLSPEKAEK